MLVVFVVWLKCRFVGCFLLAVVRVRGVDRIVNYENEARMRSFRRRVFYYISSVGW